MSSDDVTAYCYIIEELYERYLNTPKDSEHLIEYIKNNYDSEIIPKIIYMIKNHILLGVWCQKSEFGIKIIIRLGELYEIKPQYNAIIERSFKMTESGKISTPSRAIDPVLKLIKHRYTSLPQDCKWSYKGHDHIDVLIK